CPLRRLAREQLRQRRFAGERAAALAQPGRAQREHPRRVDLGPRPREREPDRLELDERLSELPPLTRVSERALDRGTRDPDRLRRDADASAIETGERDAEPAADLDEHRVGADARVVADARDRTGRDGTEHVTLRDAAL